LRLNVRAYLRYMVAAVISIVLVSRIQCSSDFLNLVIRGALSVVAYGGVLWAIDQRFRLMVRDIVRSRSKVLKKQESQVTAAPALETGSKLTSVE